MVSQIIVVSIFLVMFLLIIADRFPRQYVTLICGALTLLLVFVAGMSFDNRFFNAGYNPLLSIKETLNVHSIFTPGFWYAAGESESKGINWATILFIAGMMVMVEGMARTGFFRWLCMRLAKAVHYKVISIFIAFMIMSFALAMFIDSITVILFLAAVSVELSRLLKFNPVSMILAEVFCANLGGSATMCGDPPNIIIGTSLGYSFAGFLMNTGEIALVCLIFTVLYFYFMCRKQYSAVSSDVDVSAFPSPESAITDKKGFAVSCVIFLVAVVLLVTHSSTHLSVATIGVGIGLVTLIASARHIKEILSRIDYQTLLFFVGLFIVVGGLEQTHVLELIAMFIEKVSGGNLYGMIAIIIWISALASAFIDNIPFAATVVPVIQNLASVTGANFLPTMAWSLAIGTDIGGSATPIGASANVVGTSVAAKAGHPVGWGKYCRLCAPITVIVLLISTIFVFVRYL